MKTSLQVFLLTAMFFLCPVEMRSQNSECDVIFLKNGSMIKGKIIEIIPEKSIKIEIVGGSIFTYPMSEIEKITKESAKPVPLVAVISDNDNSSMSGLSFGIFGGSAAGAGNFSSGGEAFATWIKNIVPFQPQNPGFIDHGCAREGVMAGIKFTVGGTVGWTINAAYAQNNISPNSPAMVPIGTSSFGTVDIQADKWTSLIVSTGVKLGTANSSLINFFVAPLVGVVHATSPNITATIKESGDVENITLRSATSNAVAYGVNIEFTFWGHIIVGVHYYYSPPHYDVPYTIAYGSTSQSGIVSHDELMSLILPYFGISF